MGYVKNIENVFQLKNIMGELYSLWHSFSQNNRMNNFAKLDFSSIVFAARFYLSWLSIR